MKQTFIWVQNTNNKIIFNYYKLIMMDKYICENNNTNNKIIFSLNNEYYVFLLIKILL